MSGQSSLFDEGPPARMTLPDPSRRGRPGAAKVGAWKARDRAGQQPPSLEEHPNDAAARTFHVAHPEVWRLFSDRARQAIAAGLPKFSARTIWETIRWESTAGDHAGEFKLNDHFVPWYARRFLAEPDCPAGFFEVRR